MSETYSQTKFAEAKLNNGWNGRLSLDYPVQAWSDALDNIDSVLSDPVEIFRDHDSSRVMRKNITLAGETVSVVVKHDRPEKSITGFLRTLGPAKSFRFLDTFSQLDTQNIPTVNTLAAIQKKVGPSTSESILITEYIEQSDDLYWFMRKNRPSFAMKKALSAQIAQILAKMHKAGLWHRDAKAQNFLVTPVENKDSMKLSLLDLDGIKSYGIRMERARDRTLAKLAATLLSFRHINKTDYLRTFRIYCKLTNIDINKCPRIFRRLAKQSTAIRLLTMARAATSSVENRQT